MFHVVLFQPEIAPNVGNIMRLCANTGCHLHLVGPLGFQLDDRRLRRAGLDYREWASVREYATLNDFKEVVRPPRLFACSTKGRRDHTQLRYQPDDAVLFGPETRGLPSEILGQFASGQIVRIPMVQGSRSLNLSNAVAVVAYEMWRQIGFAGAHRGGQ